MIKPNIMVLITVLMLNRMDILCCNCFQNEVLKFQNSTFVVRFSRKLPVWAERHGNRESINA